jgi:sensor histidine kinase YesM
MNINKYHIFFWLSFFTFFISLDYLQYPEYTFWQRELYMSFLHLCVFYSFLFALAKFKKGSIKNWAKSICLFVLSYGLIMFLNHWRGKIAAKFGYNIHETFYLLFIDTFRTYCMLAFYALGYYYLNRSNLKEKQLRQAEQQKAAADLAAAQTQQNLLEMENQFLRAQINPHFLYNTLNTFYAEALNSNQRLANAIVLLSNIMRYSLESTRNGELVPLRMEVEHLKQVISLHQLRFEEQLPIEFTTLGPLGKAMVAPLIFITLLENAFKHGNTNNSQQPITMHLTVDEQHVRFSIHNQIGSDTFDDDSHGIGLPNIQKRLYNLYGSRYGFTAQEREGRFYVELYMPYVANSE